MSEFYTRLRENHNLHVALLASDANAFNGGENGKFNQADHNERIEAITENIWDNDKLIDEMIINDDVIIASLKAMVKALNNKNQESAIVFAKSVQIQLNELVNTQAEKEA